MSAGKGDKPRPVDGEKFRSNYDKIFKKENPEVKDDRLFIPPFIDGKSTEGISWRASVAPIGTFKTTIETKDYLVMEDENGNRCTVNKKSLDKINFK